MSDVTSTHKIWWSIAAACSSNAAVCGQKAAQDQFLEKIHGEKLQVGAEGGGCKKERAAERKKVREREGKGG